MNVLELLKMHAKQGYNLDDALKEIKELSGFNGYQDDYINIYESYLASNVTDTKCDKPQDRIEKPSREGYSVFKIQGNTLQHVETVGVVSDEIIEPSGHAISFFTEEI